MSWKIKVQPSWQQELGQWFLSMPVLAGQCKPILQSRSWGSMVKNGMLQRIAHNQFGIDGGLQWGKGSLQPVHVMT